MAEVALVPSTLSEQPEKKAWERMDGESTRWYSRYKRFQGLGPKRTVLAAVEQERKQSKAPKSTRSQEKPKPKKPASVPGSWKAASIRWCWVERAQAYDEDKVDKMVTAMFEDLFEGPALAFYRVLELRNILTTVQKDFNTNNARMTADQKIAYYSRMQKILRDIAGEMRVFDAPTQRLVLQHFAFKEYQEHTSPLTPARMLQLQEQAGGMESLTKAIEREKARREELAQLKEMLGETGVKQE